MDREALTLDHSYTKRCAHIPIKKVNREHCETYSKIEPNQHIVHC